MRPSPHSRSPGSGRRPSLPAPALAVIGVLVIGFLAVLAGGGLVQALRPDSLTESPSAPAPVRAGPSNSTSMLRASSTATALATSTPTLIPTSAPDPRVEMFLSQMSLADLAGQTIMTGINGTTMLPVTCSRLAEARAGAVIYRGGNVIDPWQLQAFSLGLQDCAHGLGLAGGLLIAVDHEGEMVYRFDSGATVFPSAMALGAAADPELAYQVALAAGEELAFSGVNMVLGPVADVVTQPANTVISIRSFGGDPQRVAEMVARTVAGYWAAGVAPVLKHFPGHGAVAVDSHQTVPSDLSDAALIDAVHLVPFRAGLQAGAPAVMLGHIALPALDPSGSPASLSPVIIQEVLRGRLAFDGVALTDALEMAAVGGDHASDVAEAAVRALAAGADMVLVESPYEALSVHDRIVQAVASGEIPLERLMEAARRILCLKFALLDQVLPPSTVDWAAHQALAYEAGRRGVTLVRDQAGWVPLPTSWQRLLVVCPDGFEWIPQALAESGRSVSQVGFTVPRDGPVPEALILSSVPGTARAYDGVVVCTWGAYRALTEYGDGSQADMVLGLLGAGAPTVVIALRSPFDLIAFPAVGTYLATYGTTGGAVAGAAESLTGPWEPQGMLPLTLEP